jgi:hypothetical protein
MFDRNQRRHDDKRPAARLARRQRELARRPLQFSLRSLLAATALIGVLVWLVTFLARTQPLGIPLALCLLLLGLWASVIVGAVVSQSAW